MFDPRVALASLSGSSDSAWARAAESVAGAAFLGGIAVCEQTRHAARQMKLRDRSEFIPPDPLAFIDTQLSALRASEIRGGVNVRSVDVSATRRVAQLCATHDAIYEVNAHCRQEEMCAVGAGETLLQEPSVLIEHVRAAADTGADVSVKVRAEIPGVDLPAIAQSIEEAGGAAIHVDAMDTRTIVRDIVDAAGLFVIGNNGIRTRNDVAEFVSYGADAVSVGRASDRPAVLNEVHRAMETLDPAESDVHPPSKCNDR